ncbi:hypothetical protein IAR55_004348 [Kwoniella newhampshirensis]|uniref:Transmembrane protein n=1 Tax=Kwoniella newhampshirensis TaxID=1651941 RepID=A0AAW0Z0F7_9TREE
MSTSETYLPPTHTHAHTHGHGHSRNASSYASAENGGRSLTQRSPSPSPTKPTFGFVPDQPIPSSSTITGGGAGVGSSSSLDRNGGGGGSGYAGLTPQRIGRAIGARFMRAVRRGHLPFLIVFFSCTIVFFSALAGVGYVEPPPTDSLADGTLINPGGAGGAPVAGGGEGDAAFKIGRPVFDPSEDQRKLGLERKIAEQRALEEAWARKKRPKDGAWMRKQRDDKAIRRKPSTATKTSTAASAYDTVVAELVDTGDDGAEGLDGRAPVVV